MILTDYPIKKSSEDLDDKKEVILIGFNLWNFLNQDQIVKDFFVHLSNKLEGRGVKIGKGLIRYSKKLLSIGIETYSWFNTTPKFLDSLKNYFDTVKTKSLDEHRILLDERLKKIDEGNFMDSRKVDLVAFIDFWNQKEKFCNTTPSVLLRGGWYAMSKDNISNNPDWMAQSANSFREVHYATKKITKQLNKREGIAQTLNDFIDEDTKKEDTLNQLMSMNSCFTAIAHHFQEEKNKEETIEKLTNLGILSSDAKDITKNDYLNLVSLFENVLIEIIPKGIKAHKNIDTFITDNVSQLAKVNIRQLRTLIINQDAKNYFFSKIDHAWYKVLKENDFLDLVNLPKDTHYLPEVSYINRLVESSPDSFLDLLNTYNFNITKVPIMVLDNLHKDICYHLSVNHLDKMVKKMKYEEWVYLMRNIHQSSYEYSDTIKKLREANNFNLLLDILDIIFTPVRTADLKQGELMDGHFSFPDKLFYLDNITDSEIVTILADSSNPIKTETLDLLLNIFNKILNIDHKKKYERNVFDKAEPFFLPQLNIFKSDFRKSKISNREDIEVIIIMIRKVLDNILEEKSDDVLLIKNLEQSFKKLTYTYSSWRIRLYLLTRRPYLFSDEIKEEFNKVINNTENYYELTSGAEFHQALIDSFDLLDLDYKKDYIDKIIEKFGKSDNEKSVKREGQKILKFIEKSISQDQRKKILETFGGDLINFDGLTPHTRFSSSEWGGMVIDTSPIDNLSSLSVIEIISHLGSDWTPEKFKEEYKNDSFLRPRNASGLAKNIGEDMKSSNERLLEYLDNLPDFIDPKISQIYVYYVFNTLEEMKRSGKKFTDVEFKKILLGIEKICSLVKEDENIFNFEDNNFDVGNWYWVLNSVSKVVESLINDLDKKNFTDLRPELVNVITYLLNIKGSPNEDNERYIKDKKTGNSPQGEAINSVRGKAYKAFIILITKDGEVLMEDTKNIFLDVIKNEKSTPVKFLVGYYLFHLYIKDKDFILKIKDKLFSNDTDFAYLEGYLSSNIHVEMFNDFKDVYDKSISLYEKDLPDRTYTTDINEGLATHLALAYLNFDNTKEQQDLLNKFWTEKHTHQCKHFISFIGLTIINNDDAINLVKDKNLTPKLKSLIEDVIKLNLDHTVYSGFGFWINKEKEVLGDSYLIAKFADILEKSNGEIDWDYGFIQRLNTFANKNPKETLRAISNYFIDKNGNLSKHRLYPIYTSEEKSALEVIYKKGGYKKEIEDLINKLIEKGGSNFWTFKDIFKLK